MRKAPIPARINVLIIVMHRKTNNKYNYFMIMIIRRYCVLPAYAVRKKEASETADAPLLNKPLFFMPERLICRRSRKAKACQNHPLYRPDLRTPRTF